MHSRDQRHIVFCGLREGWKHQKISNLTGISVGQIRRISATEKPVRVLLSGDLHSGSNVGLTPPSYQFPYIENPETEDHRRRNKWAELQAECWDWYIDTLSMLKPIHKCFVLGDLIDGDGKRSGGTELITTDRKVQAAMATESLGHIEAGGMVFVYGTPYHTGTAEDFETDIAAAFNSKIGSHEWENINGVIFDLKHKQGNTMNPATSLFNEVRDNREWAVLGEQPKADILVRAHSHRFCVLEMEDCIAISIPALQAYGTKFGARQCSRKVQFGLVALDVWPDGVIQKHVHIAKLSGHITTVNQEKP